MLSAGDRVGDYEIEAELGEGGMARVYRARHTVLDTVHAIKVLEPRYRADPETRQRFLAEAKIQAKHLDHPNIIRVTNIVATPDHAALVMDLVDGPDLESLAGKIDDWDQVKELFAGVLAGVGSAHAQKIIHRDLKPANVLLARRPGGGYLPKVSDFGVAKVGQPEGGKKKRSTHADARMGTLAYMSPEQIRRAKDVTERSDIFSLGAMLYELVTGAVPFDGESDFDVMDNIVRGHFVPPRERVKKLDPVIDQVIRKALSPDPADRYASCEEMAAALREAPAAAAPAVAAAVTVASTVHPAIPKRVRVARVADPAPGRRRAALVVVAGLAAAGGAIVYFGTRGGGQPAARPTEPTGVAVAPTADADGELEPLATYDPATGILTPTGAIDGGAPAQAAHDASIYDQLELAPPSPGLVDLARAVDAGTGGRLADLGRFEPPPPDAGRLADLVSAPPPPPCKGSFRSEEGLNVRVAGTSGACGSYGFVDRSASEVRACSGALSDCELRAGTIRASFSCDYSSGPSQRLSGSMDLTCHGSRMSAEVDTGGYTRTWKLYK